MRALRLADGPLDTFWAAAMVRRAGERFGGMVSTGTYRNTTAVGRPPSQKFTLAEDARRYTHVIQGGDGIMALCLCLCMPPSSSPPAYSMRLGAHADILRGGGRRGGHSDGAFC